MPNATDKRMRARMPEGMGETYDEVLDLLYGGRPPKRTVRVDVCEMCVQSFDWLVRLIAASRHCIRDFGDDTADGTRKRLCGRSCASCIRSTCYLALLHEKIAARAAEEEKP